MKYHLISAHLSYSNFFPELIKAVPAFKYQYDEHLNDNHEILPHVLMGDLTRFIESLLGKQDKEALGNCLNFLEKAISSNDGKLRALVTASFIENLDDQSKYYQNLRSLLGPNLKQGLSRFEGSHVEKTGGIGTYLSLMKNYLHRDISAQAFQELFLTTFKNEKQQFDDQCFQILDKLFAKVDSFEPDPQLLKELQMNRPNFNIDDHNLRRSVQEALVNLATLADVD